MSATTWAALGDLWHVKRQIERVERLDVSTMTAEEAKAKILRLMSTPRKFVAWTHTRNGKLKVFRNPRTGYFDK